MDKKEEKYFNEIKKIEEVFYEFHKVISLKFPKPKNLNKEKEIFFEKLRKKEKYNPQIEFSLKEINFKKVEKLRKKVDAIKTTNDIYGLKKLYKDRMFSKFIQINYHKHWGTSLSAKYAAQFWGRPSRKTIKMAKKFAKNYKRERVKFKYISPIQIGTGLKEEVKNLTGNKIFIKYVSEMASKVNIEPTDNIIEINRNEKFTTLDLKRLRIHEIGIHYLRFYNAHKSKVALLETGTANYLETEEGLAAFNEYQNGVLSNAQMFIYSGRVLATHYSKKKSFYQIFKILQKYGFTDDVAFSITFRAKRNLSDTSKKGGFTKDYVYFQGFHKVKEYAEKYDICDLFIGKIGIDDLKPLKKYIQKNKENISCPKTLKNNGYIEI